MISTSLEERANRASELETSPEHDPPGTAPIEGGVQSRTLARLVSDKYATGKSAAGKSGMGESGAGDAGTGDAGAGESGDPSGFEGELRRALELASRWLWRDGRPRAVIGLDRSIQWCNPAARRLLVAPVPLMIRDNRLCPAKGVDSEAVDSFLAGMGSQTERLQVVDPQTERAVLLTAWSETIDGIQTAFIEFGLRELPFDAQQSGMAQTFGLTKAECRVVDALAEMESPIQIAARLGVSVHTIRTHVRRIYGKLAVRTQMQFMRLTMAYCGG